MIENMWFFEEKSQDDFQRRIVCRGGIVLTLLPCTPVLIIRYKMQWMWHYHFLKSKFESNENCLLSWHKCDLLFYIKTFREGNIQLILIWTFVPSKHRYLQKVNVINFVDIKLLSKNTIHVFTFSGLIYIQQEFAFFFCITGFSIIFCFFCTFCWH